MFKIIVFVGLLMVPTLPVAERDRISFSAKYTIPIVPVGPTTFEVIEADGAGGTQLWCAGGIFTRRVLGVERGNLTVKNVRGPSQMVLGRKAVKFTTDIVPGAKKSYSEGDRTAGKTMSIAHANALCDPDVIGNLKIRLPNGQLVYR